MPRTNVFSKRRKVNIGVFGRKRKRRRRRVSKRLKRAIKRIAFADTEVRWLDVGPSETAIRDFSTVADSLTTTNRLGNTATTGFMAKPIQDANAGAGIALGTGATNRTSDHIYAIGVKAIVKIAYKPVETNNDSATFVRMVWGYKHPNENAYSAVNLSSIYGGLTAGPGTVISQALFPWGVNRVTANYEARQKYHISGSKVFRIAQGNGGTGGAFNAENVSNTREAIFKWNWPMRQKIEFPNTVDYPVSNYVPFIFMYADEDADNAYSTQTTGVYCKFNYRFYWKNID
jgi:hypothetical protein